MLRSHFIQRQCNNCRYNNRRYNRYPCTQGDYELQRGRDCSYWKPLPWFMRLFRKIRGKGNVYFDFTMCCQAFLDDGVGYFYDNFVVYGHRM